jgi:hypothetical protein
MSKIILAMAEENGHEKGEREQSDIGKAGHSCSQI